MRPYFSENGIEIYHGDCSDVLPNLKRMGGEVFDLLLTDPPYGLGEARRDVRAKRCGSRPAFKAKGGRVIAPMTEYGDADWDNVPASDELIAKCRSYASKQIIFGGNFFGCLPPASCWLVWDKENGGTDFADCELAWTNLDRAVRMKRHRWNGMLQKYGTGNSPKKEPRYHPTQKPLEVMTWAISLAGDDVITVVDPFMGSGTTLVAAKLLGRKCVGIEKIEKYCEDAAKRLAQGVLPLAPRPPLTLDAQHSATPKTCRCAHCHALSAK